MSLKRRVSRQDPCVWGSSIVHRKLISWIVPDVNFCHSHLATLVSACQHLSPSKSHWNLKEKEAQTKDEQIETSWIISFYLCAHESINSLRDNIFNVNSHVVVAAPYVRTEIIFNKQNVFLIQSTTSTNKHKKETERKKRSFGWTWKSIVQIQFSRDYWKTWNSFHFVQLTLKLMRVDCACVWSISLLMAIFRTF